MGFKFEVYEANGESFFWFADTIEEVFNELGFYYTKEELKKVEKIEIYPLTNEE